MKPPTRAAGPPAPPSTAPVPAPLRPDGEASRERLMLAGLRLFAEKGFAATTVRELVDAAGVNIAAVRYYFGDKLGLYRAVFFEPLGEPETDLARFRDPALPLDAALEGFFEAFLAPMADGEAARLCVKLRMREMLEPTGLWEQEMTQAIQPMHRLLVEVICRHLGLARADDDVHRLAICISALGVHIHIGRDVMDLVAPQLMKGRQPVDRWRAFLVRQGVAMVDAERRRRRAA